MVNKDVYYQVSLENSFNNRDNSLQMSTATKSQFSTRVHHVHKK